MCRFFQWVGGGLAPDHVLWRLEMRWKYAPLWHACGAVYRWVREAVCQAALDGWDCASDRLFRVWLLFSPRSYRR